MISLKNIKDLKKKDLGYDATAKIVKKSYNQIGRMFKRDVFVQELIKKINKAIDEKNSKDYDTYTKQLNKYLIARPK